MVKIKNFLYGTAVLVASVAALYGFTLIEKSRSPVQFQGSGATGGGGYGGGVTNIGFGF